MSDYEKTEATIEAQKILSAVVRLQERFGVNYVVDLLRGSTTVKAEHQSLKTYGIGKDISNEQWKQYIRELLYLGYLEQSVDKYPVLKLTAKSWKILKGEEQISLVKSIKEKKELVPKQQGPFVYADLLQELKQLRDQIARKENLPPDLIFSDTTLVELASYLPHSLVDLERIPGFGNVKIGKYGSSFLNTIRSYCREKKITSMMHLKNAKAGKPDKKVNDTKRYTFQLFKEGKPIEAIAAMRELAVSTVEGHLNFFIRSGELDIHELLPKQKVSLLLKEVQESEGYAAAPIKEKLGDDYSYREIKAVISYWQWMKDSGIEI